MPGENEHSRWFELAVSGGIVVYVASATVAGLIWVGSIDERVSNLKDTVGSLDNVALGTRITTLETQVRLFGLQQDRIETKIDKLLDRQSRGTP